MKKLNAGIRLTKLGLVDADNYEVLQQATFLISSCYGEVKIYDKVQNKSMVNQDRKGP
jgi:hypothetical protein